VAVGAAGSGAFLIKALAKSGTKEMAEHFLNCGNSLLEDAAQEWASSHGYTITQVAGQSRPMWGSNP
jgi:hypothetical protein